VGSGQESNDEHAFLKTPTSPTRDSPASLRDRVVGETGVSPYPTCRPARCSCLAPCRPSHIDTPAPMSPPWAPSLSYPNPVMRSGFPRFMTPWGELGTME